MSLDHGLFIVGFLSGLWIILSLPEYGNRRHSNRLRFLARASRYMSALLLLPFLSGCQLFQPSQSPISVLGASGLAKALGSHKSEGEITVSWRINTEATAEGSSPVVQEGTVTIPPADGTQGSGGPISGDPHGPSTPGGEPEPVSQPLPDGRWPTAAELLALNPALTPDYIGPMERWQQPDRQPAPKDHIVGSYRLLETDEGEDQFRWGAINTGLYKRHSESTGEPVILLPAYTVKDGAVPRLRFHDTYCSPRKDEKGGALVWNGLRPHYVAPVRDGQPSAIVVYLWDGRKLEGLISDPSVERQVFTLWDEASSPPQQLVHEPSNSFDVSGWDWVHGTEWRQEFE